MTDPDGTTPGLKFTFRKLTVTDPLQKVCATITSNCYCTSVQCYQIRQPHGDKGDSNVKLERASVSIIRETPHTAIHDA